jgi:hypothetical protein
MKHPDREEWVPFLFGEADGPRRNELNQHLASCPACAREVAAWQRSLRQLDRWRLPAQPKPPIIPFQPALKWALAAALVLGAGVLIGRLTSPGSANIAALRDQVSASVQASLRMELNDAMDKLRAETDQRAAATEARLATASAAETQRVWRTLLEALDNARTEDGRAVEALLRDYQQQHNEEFVSLRKDLETLASMTDEELRQARLRLVQLAAVNNPKD